ncbi:hypothetical protein [Alteribacter aurantiacus]|uniref:hypothetical protein n=1 Tax=Alteribacter aurantiacus TaxID=254410 RepID=UPI001969B074|nr:hypothetical protein [Alteribacter aurantiacus]
MLINFVVHVVPAFLLGQFFFGGFDSIVALTTVMGVFFFAFDEWPHTNGRKQSNMLKVTPVVMIFVALTPTWLTNYHVSKESSQLDEVGFPEANVFINDEKVIGEQVSKSFSSTGFRDDERNPIGEPYLLPKGILQDPQYKVNQVEEGDRIRIDFSNQLSHNYTLEIAYLIGGEVVTKEISSKNNELVVPTNLKAQAMPVSATWRRHNISFQLWVK